MVKRPIPHQELLSMEGMETSMTCVRTHFLGLSTYSSKSAAFSNLVYLLAIGIKVAGHRVGWEVAVITRAFWTFWRAAEYVWPGGVVFTDTVLTRLESFGGV